MMKQLDVNADFISALTVMEDSQDCIFLTGNAGTGKSTLLSYFRETSKKRIVVLAPTGIAALNVKGETIHSFFKFKPNITVETAKKKGSRLKNTHLFESLDAIVIDEISMVRADMLDCIDVFLRAALKKELPFGGKQLIMIGDLHQLPPVVTPAEKQYFRDVYESPYFFSAEVCTHPDFHMNTIKLTKIYRQEDEQFIDILNGIRNKDISQEQLNQLNSRLESKNNIAGPGHIYLTTTNANAERVNAQKLGSLPEDPVTLNAIKSGKFDSKMAPTDTSLQLKEGAQVMFLNNDANGRWVNGSIGHVIEIDDYDENVHVQVVDGKRVVVSPHQWTLYTYVYEESTQRIEQKKAGSFRQFPLKLAWAITIHKSQGKTFDSVVVDLGYGAFASGQVYVAFSRCTRLDGLILKAPLRKNQIVLDPRVSDFI